MASSRTAPTRAFRTHGCAPFLYDVAAGCDRGECAHRGYGRSCGIGDLAPDAAPLVIL